MSTSFLQRAREEDRDSSLPPRTPLWVKVFGISFSLLVLLFLAMMLGNLSTQMMPGMSNMGSSTSRNLPLWIQVVGFVALVVVLGFFIALLAGVGGRGSGRTVPGTRKATAAILPPSARKLALTTHIIASVGWIGAVVTFLVLAVTQLASQNAVMVRGTFLAMDATAWLIIAPLSLTSLLTGLVLALFTKWGLFRNYWILAKLLINVFASVVLLMYVQSLNSLAGIAAAATLSGADLLALKNADSVQHSSIALVVLLVAVVLSVYKPRGLTRYGWRKQHEQRKHGTAVNAARHQAQEIEYEFSDNDVRAATLK